MKAFILFISLAVAFCVNGQTTPLIDPSSVGFIVVDSTQFVGTGFVMDTKRQVITCAHFIGMSKSIYYGTGDIHAPHNGLHKLKVAKLLLPYDLVVLESETDLCITPLRSVPKTADASGQHVFYLGYELANGNTTLTSMQTKEAKILGKYSDVKGLFTAEHYTFLNAIADGYSGSPVLDDNDQVVGIVNLANAGISADVILSPTPITYEDIAYSIQPVAKN